MKRVLSDADKAAIKAKQEQAAAFRKSDDVVAVVAEFKPRFSQIAANITAAWQEIEPLVAELIEACALTHDADGRKQFNSLLRLLTLEPYVAQVAGNFASIYMAGINLNVLITEDGKERRKYANDARGVKQAAKDANVALGIARKREKSGAKSGPTVTVETIWPMLAECLKTESGRALARKTLNDAGYEMTPLAKAGIPEEALVKMEQTGRRIRKAA